MSKKNRTTAPVSVIEETTETTETLLNNVSSVESSEDFAPVTKSEKRGFGNREIGFFGFGKGSGSEALAIALSDTKGKTLEELKEAYRAIRPGSDSRSSVGVFLSDVARPFLSDSGSTVGRSVVVEKSASGKYRFSPASLAASLAAIESGILSEIRKVPARNRNPKNPEYSEILSRYGFGEAEETK